MKKCISISSLVLLTVALAANGYCQAAGYYDSLYVQWTREVTPFLTSSIDVPSAIVTDAGGNAYVTGKSENSGTDFDYLTIKYDLSGNELWRDVYSGSGGMADIPIDLAVDGAGNCFVTGMSVSAESNSFDIVTIKYDQSGKIEWITRYDGPENGVDAPVSVVTTGIGGAVVTGYAGRDLHRDIVTVRYSSSGEVEWIRSYDGPDHLDDRPYNMIMASSGDVIITGASQEAAANRRDLILIRYSSDGTVAWISKHISPDGVSSFRPAGLAEDSGGSLIVSTAHYDGNWSRQRSDIVVISFNPAGEIAWSRTFGEVPHSPSLTLDFPTGIATNDDNDIYVSGVRGPYHSLQNAGESIITIKYSSEGWEAWSRSYPAASGKALRSSGILLNPSGNPVLAATIGTLSPPHLPTFVGESTLLLSYGANGELLRQEERAGTEGIERELHGFAIGATESIVTAESSGPPDLHDILVRSNRAAEGSEWEARSTGTGRSVSSVMDGTVDESGNIYACGSSLRPGGKSALSAWKMDSNGNLLWWKRLDSLDTGGMNPSSPFLLVTVDQRLVVVASYEHRSILISFDAATGDQLWQTWLDGAWGFIDDDPWGNIIVSSYQMVQKVDPSGAIVWGMPTSWYTFCLTDNQGNIYCSINGALSKLAPDGTGIWTSSIVLDFFLAVDDSGYVYGSLDQWPYSRLTRISPDGVIQWDLQTGYGLPAVYGGRSYSGAQGVLSAVDLTGNLLWQFEIPGNGFMWRQFMWRQFTAGRSDEIFIAGSYLPDTFHDWEIRTDRIAPDGTVLPALLFGSGGTDAHLSMAVGSDTSGNVYVIGERIGRTGETNPIVIKYGRANITASAEEKGQVPAHFRLAQNYPNPFNPTTNIRFGIRDAGFVMLDVYDLLGRKVGTVVNERLPAGSYTRQWDAGDLPSGVYFYRLTAGNSVETKRMILLK